MKVLLVGDKPDLLEQVKLFLEKKDDRLNIVNATSAEKGLEMLDKSCYDAVISDSQMSGMDGLEFLETLRKQGNNIPFIIFTSREKEEVAMKASEKAEDKEKFLYSLLRHDLKNKAQIAQGYHGLLKDTGLSETQKQYLEKAEKGVQESLELVDKVRMLREIEEEEVGEVSIDPIIENAINKNEQAFENGIEIDYERGNETVFGGPLLEELFSNLIENSIKHSYGNKIKISSREHDNECIVTVEDNGTGFSKELKSHLFQPLHASKGVGGSGLGLHLVKRIAEAYGGSVELKESVLGGARLDVHLEKARGFDQFSQRQECGV